MLVDTSVWIEYLRDTGSAAHRRLASAVDAEATIALTEPIWAELLAGATRADERGRLERFLGRFDLLPVSGLEGYRRAAHVYLACRRAGFTPRSMFDCLIAAVAIEHEAELLHLDRDFDRIARHLPLRIAEI